MPSRNCACIKSEYYPFIMQPSCYGHIDEKKKPHKK